MILEIPDELEEEFDTFLEVGLASVTAYSDEMTQAEQRLVQVLEIFLSTASAKRRQGSWVEQLKN